MENKKTFFDYAAQTLIIFGLMVVFLSVCSCLAGDEGSAVSSLFRLGSRGMSMSSLAQMFALSILTTLVRAIFLSDRIFRKMPSTARILAMIICCIAVIVVFVILFDWFPSDKILPWLLFALSFGVCFTFSFVLTLSKQKRENKAMAEALERLKNDE